MPLRRATELVQLLLHRVTSSHLTPIHYCSAHFSALPTLLPLIHSEYNIPFTASLPLTTPGSLNNPLPLMVHRNFTLTDIHSQLSFFAYSSKVTHQYPTSLNQPLVLYLLQITASYLHHCLPLWLGGLEFSQRLLLCVS